MNNRTALGWLSFLGVWAALALAACSEGTEPEPDVSGTTLPAAVETTTTAAPATTTTAPATTTTTVTTTTTIPTAAGFEVSIDDDTLWRGVLDSLAEAEQTCIGEALDDELETVMDLAVLSGDGDEEWLAPLLACLGPDTARELYLAIIIAGVEEDLTAGVGPQEEACMRERLSDEDVPALAADSESPDAARFFGEMMGCIPDVLFSMFMEEMLGATGAASLEIREEQVSCVQDALAGTDWAMFIDGSEPEDPEAAADFLDGVVSCIPDVFVSLIVSEIEAETGELSEEARSCLRGVVIDLDWSAILGGAETEILAAFLPGLIGCAPELLFLDGEGVLSGDDHGDIADDDATPVALGEAIDGVRDHDYDIDVFVFEAAAGELYQIDVTPGTLSDTTVTLYDADGLELGYNDDYGTTLASRLHPEATDSGPHYVAVSGYGAGTGTYTLTVTVLDIVDDHGDRNTEATPVTLGEAVEGVLDYDGDVDVFMFEAAAGESYQIDVTPGTLSYSIAALYDAEGLSLAYSEGYGGTLASRLYWEATDSGPLHFGVEGYGTGTYTLTVANFVDDHGDLIDEATPAALGEAIEGVLELGSDADVFVFEAAAGELYQIDVAPGTLNDPTVTLYDAEGLELGYNDDYGDTLASRLRREATDSGPHYVAVEGYGTGTYTLTVTVLDFVDDHGNRNAEATPAVLGEAVGGVLDYDEDVDVFMFEAAAGELYQIDVAPGTLENPTVRLRDADGLELAYYDDLATRPASRLYWEATNSGPHYVAVEGYGAGAGTYTLTIVQR